GGCLSFGLLLGDVLKALTMMWIALVAFWISIPIAFVVAWKWLIVWAVILSCGDMVLCRLAARRSYQYGLLGLIAGAPLTTAALLGMTEFGAPDWRHGEIMNELAKASLVGGAALIGGLAGGYVFWSVIRRKRLA